MRIPSLIFGSVLACGLAFAGHNEAVVYTGGNLTGIIPRANAVLDLSQDIAMKLRIGRTDVSVPFSSITKTDSAADSTAVPAPGQRLVKPFELLTVEFNSLQGEPRTMTLEMSKLSASHVMATIHKHVPAETKVSAVQNVAADSDSTASAAAAAATTAAAEAPAAAAPATAPAQPEQSASNQPAEPAKPAKSVKAAKAPKPDQQAKVDKANADKQAKTDKAKAAQQAKTDKANAEKQAKLDKKAAQVAKKNKKDKKDEENQSEAANAGTFKSAPKKDAWWGDDVWKTNRNVPKWDQTAGATAAQ